MPITKRPALSTNWTEINPDASVLSMVADPFSIVKAGLSPDDALVWRTRGNMIERSSDGGVTWVDVTPSGSVDGIAISSLTFVDVDGSYVYADLFGAIGNFNNGGIWISWLFLTADDGVTWDTTNLGYAGAFVPGAYGDEQVVQDVSGDGDTVYGEYIDYLPVPDFLRDVRHINGNVAILSDTQIIVSWFTRSDGAGSITTHNISARAGTVNPVAKTISWGPVKIVFDVGNITDIYQVSCNVGCDANHSLICYGWVHDEGPPITNIVSKPLRIRVLDVDGSNVITLGAEQTIDVNHSFRASIPAAAKTSTNNVVILYEQRESIWQWNALRYINIDPILNTFTLGPERLNNNASFVNTTSRRQRQQIISLTSDLLVILWAPAHGATYLPAVEAVWRTGDDFLFGIRTPPLFFDAGFGFNEYNFKLERQNDSRFVVSYIGDNSVNPLLNGFGTKIGLVSGLVTGPPSESVKTVFFGDPQYFTPPNEDVSEKVPQATYVADDVHIVLYGPGERFVSVVWSGDVATFGTEVDEGATLDRTTTYQQWYYLGGTIMLREYSDLLEETVNIKLLEFSNTIGDFKGLGLQFSQVVGNFVWATVWSESNELYLVGFDLFFGNSGRFLLGACTEAQLDARTFAAWPLADRTNELGCYVYGRMNAPAGLSNPEHVIRTANLGATFTSIDNTMGSLYVGSMFMLVDGVLYAIRNGGSSSDLFTGSAAAGLSLKSALPFPSDCEPGGMVVDQLARTVIAVARTADPIMVATSDPPYSSWIDITDNHGVSIGIPAVVIL